MIDIIKVARDAKEKDRLRVAKWRKRNKDKVRKYRSSLAFKESVRASTERKRKAIQKIKTTSGCIDCGYNKHPDALDFDHVNGDKSFAIASNVSSKTLDALLAEIAKCVVRCANCHRIKTARENRNRYKLPEF